MLWSVGAAPLPNISILVINLQPAIDGLNMMRKTKSQVYCLIYSLSLLAHAPNYNIAFNFNFVFKKNNFGLTFHKVLLLDLVHNSCSFQEAAGKTLICFQPRLPLKKQSILLKLKKEKKKKDALKSTNVKNL